MSNLEKHAEDIKFEWLAGYMLYHKHIQSLENMDIHLLGIFSRYVSKEIENIKVKQNTTTFEINREGLYDAMPQGLFHRSKTFESYQMDVSQVKEEIKAGRIQEREARKFFSIFENEMYKLHVLAEIYARDIISGLYGKVRKDVELLVPFDISIFSKEEQVKILLALPFVRPLKSMPPEESIVWLVDFVLQCNSQAKVEFRLNNYEIHKDKRPKLGNCFLGWDTVLGWELEEWVKSIKIVISKNENTEISTFYADKIIVQKIEHLCNWILPLTMTCIIEKNIPETIFGLNGNMMVNRLGHLN